MPYKYIIVSLLLLSISCNQDRNQFKIYTGEAIGNKIGLSYEAMSFANDNTVSNTGIDIRFHEFDQWNYNVGSLYFFRIPLELGRFELEEGEWFDEKTTVGAQYQVTDDDAFLDSYSLLIGDNVNDFMEITEIRNKKIKGNFQLSLIKVFELDPMNPDTIVFQNCTFDVKIEN